MSRKNQLDSCFQKVELFFDHFEIKSFTENKFAEIFSRNRENWKVPSSKNSRHLLHYLVSRDVLYENIFLVATNERKRIFSWKTRDEFTVISGLKSDSYFTHYSALYLHQLSLQIPKTIYLNFEHNPIMNSKMEENSLTQSSIDNAFKGSQRKSLSSYSFFDKKIYITNGKYTGKLGVIKKLNDIQCFDFTDLERTLIDISVRPVYSGGVFEVLEAYRLAKNKVNVAKMADYLVRLNYIYPYHQVIGFYMEKAGYTEADLGYFTKEIQFNFYLTYDIRNKAFSDRWKLFYPKGF